MGFDVCLSRRPAESELYCLAPESVATEVLCGMILDVTLEVVPPLAMFHILDGGSLLSCETVP